MQSQVVVFATYGQLCPQVFFAMLIWSLALPSLAAATVLVWHVVLSYMPVCRGCCQLGILSGAGALSARGSSSSLRAAAVAWDVVHSCAQPDLIESKPG